MPRRKAQPQQAQPQQTLASERGDSSLQVQARRRRYSAHRGVIQELRRISIHMQPAIPRLPFQRLVREICEQYMIGMRWMPSAVLCLQEIAEDYMIEFMEDSYILAAHAHRVTVMPRDFDTNRRLCYRYDQMLQPPPISDSRMYNILALPPVHPRRRSASPHQASHTTNTRSQRQRIFVQEVLPEEPQPPEPLPDVPQHPVLEPEPVPVPKPMPQDSGAGPSEEPEDLNDDVIDGVLRTEVVNDLQEYEEFFRSADATVDATINCALTVLGGQREVISMDMPDVLCMQQFETQMTTDTVVHAAML